MTARLQLRTNWVIISTTILLLITRTCAVSGDNVIDVHSNKYYDGKALTVPFNNDATIELYQRWMEQAYSGLFAAIASSRLKNASPKVQDDLKKCSKNSFDVIQHAHCLKSLISHTKKSRVVSKSERSPSSFITTNLENINNNNNINSSINDRLLKYSHKIKQQKITAPHYRGKRSEDSTIREEPSIVHRSNYNLLDSRNGFGPFGTVANLLTKLVLVSKNKTKITEWRSTVNKLKAYAEKNRKKEENKPQIVEQVKQSQGDIQNSSIEQYPLKEETHKSFSFRGLKEKEVQSLDDSINDPEGIKKLIEAARRQQNTQAGSSGDINVGARISDLVREGVKLGYSLAGENATDFDNKTMRLVSPRFFSVVAENTDDDTLNLLSPSVLSMHDKGVGLEKAISLPSLMRDFDPRDQTQWLNFVMEAAGINDEADNLKEMKNTKPTQQEMSQLDIETWKKARQQYDKEIRGEDGQPLYFIKQNITERYGDFETRKIETFERLMKTYTEEQLHQLNTTGYAVLTTEQLKLLYGPDSPYNHSSTLNQLLALNSSDVHHGIETDIYRTAEMRSFQIRQKDIVSSPIISSPIVAGGSVLSQSVILSPLVLSPVILTPAVLGPIILSPWVFIPVIISPRVLSPLIVNPLIFSPIVLSPLVLHPLILSPGVFNPLILSPLLLSPLILSPQVFTPLILSPMLLNPIILNPMVGSPLILSPFLLSPIILSPQLLFAVVLSPYALSPIIETKLIVSTVVLSPSWLS